MRCVDATIHPAATTIARKLQIVILDRMMILQSPTGDYLLFLFDAFIVLLQECKPRFAGQSINNDY